MEGVCRVTLVTKWQLGEDPQGFVPRVSIVLQDSDGVGAFRPVDPELRQEVSDGVNLTQLTSG